MADDGGFFDVDPNQPGALVGSPNLSPNDPLYDWAQKASTLAPQDMHQFVYDPQGATQNLINKGIQPPDHHYDSMGNPISADDAAKLDAAKAQLGQNLTAQFGVNPPAGSGMSRAFGVASPFPGGTTTEGATSAPPAQPPGQVYVPGQGMVPRPQAPAPVPLPAPRPAGADQTAPPPAPAPTPAQATQAPAAAGPPMFKPPGAKVATDEQAAQAAQEWEEKRKARAAELQAGDEGKGKKKKAKDEDEDVKPYSSQAMSDFSKSLAGIKMPERPKLTPPGTPSVRSPVGVTPNVNQLLALAGQPGGAPTALAKLQALLGRSLT